MTIQQQTWRSSELSVHLFLGSTDENIWHVRDRGVLGKTGLFIYNTDMEINITLATIKITKSNRNPKVSTHFSLLSFKPPISSPET